MTKKTSQNQRSRLTPMQTLVVVVLLLIAGGIYEITGQNSAGQPEPAASQPAPAVETAQHGPTVPASPTDTTAPADPAATYAPALPAPGDAGAAGGTALLPDMPGQFDYFVLALSWSPDYCASSGGSDPQQCAVGRKLGFVLHGLWPQNTRGYPSDCSNETLPASVKSRFPGLYPSASLYEHEWSKHGTCTGLSPEGYLSAAKQLKQAVRIPDAYRSPAQPFRVSAAQLKEAFTTANSTFKAADFEPNCSGSGRFLKELYVCFSRQGQPAACSAELHREALKSCGNPDFLVRNTR